MVVQNLHGSIDPGDSVGQQGSEAIMHSLIALATHHSFLTAAEIIDIQFLLH